MRVVVTAKDITRGRRSIADRCPVALALQRTTRRRWEVYFTHFSDVRRQRGYPTPLAVADFCEKFDDGIGVRPFAFELVA
jgi:hypothetical protein